MFEIPHGVSSNKSPTTLNGKKKNTKSGTMCCQLSQYAPFHRLYHLVSQDFSHNFFSFFVFGAKQQKPGLPADDADIHICISESFDHAWSVCQRRHSEINTNGSCVVLCFDKSFNICLQRSFVKKSLKLNDGGLPLF